jgi:hypothetical protein
MEPKLTLRQIDCASSKDGGLLLSLHLLPASVALSTNGDKVKRIRRRRKRQMTNTQMLEIARTVIDEAVSDRSELGRAAIAQIGAGAKVAPRPRSQRTPRRPPWPG